MPSPRTELALRTPADAERILDHFNGFHDGFLRELRLCSRDAFAQHGPEAWQVEHRLSGRFDAVVDFARYNYGDGPRPLDRIVRGRFRDVSDFLLDLRGVAAHEWPIRSVGIETDARSREGGASEACFALELHWSALEGERWSTRSARLLRFAEADFEEL